MAAVAGDADQGFAGQGRDGADGVFHGALGQRDHFGHRADEQTDGFVVGLQHDHPRGFGQGLMRQADAGAEVDHGDDLATQVHHAHDMRCCAAHRQDIRHPLHLLNLEQFDGVALATHLEAQPAVELLHRQGGILGHLGLAPARQPTPDCLAALGQLWLQQAVLGRCFGRPRQGDMAGQWGCGRDGSLTRQPRRFRGGIEGGLQFIELTGVGADDGGGWRGRRLGEHAGGLGLGVGLLEHGLELVERVAQRCDGRGRRRGLGEHACGFGFGMGLLEYRFELVERIAGWCGRCR